MFSSIKRALMRLLRTAADVAIAIALFLLIDWLSGLQIPVYFAPLITGIIAAIAKFIRDELKVKLPF